MLKKILEIIIKVVEAVKIRYWYETIEIKF